MSLKKVRKGVYRSEGPTPIGGVYAIHYCFDECGNPCSIKKAASIKIQEIDTNGKIIKETFGTTTKEQKKMVAKVHKTKYLKFSSGGFFQGHKKISVERKWRKIVAKAQQDFGGSEKGSEIKLSEKEFFEYICAIYECGIWGWEKKYVNENIMDGHQWELSIKLKGEEEQCWYGSNKYPEEWNQFLDAVNCLDLPNV